MIRVLAIAVACSIAASSWSIGCSSDEHAPPPPDPATTDPGSEAQGSEAQGSEAQGSEAQNREARGSETQGSGPAAALCLPLVSGCGCAYVCAWSVRQIGEGRHQVAHDHQDSRLDEATVERRCFDTAGHAHHEQGAPPEAANCRDVFYDQTPCGGECIPSTNYLNCHVEGDRCVP